MRSALPVLSLLVISCCLAPLGYAHMFTGFHAYDDEGIFLVALRDYLAGNPLMTPYVPLYGPFYYEVYGGLFKLLGIAPAHDSGRWLTLVVWLTASVVGGLVVWRLTQKRWLALGAQIVTFTGLLALANEPTSTYALSTLLLIALVGIVVSPMRARTAALLIGATVAALCLIKVNLGVFAVLAVVFAWSGTLARRRRRLLFAPTAVVIAVFPLVLTSSLWREAWVVDFAVLVALSIAAVGVACAFSDEPTSSVPPLRWMVAGGVATLVVVIGVALVGGSRPSDIFNFFFVFPLRFPNVFTAALEIAPVELAWAALVLIAALAVALVRPRIEIPAAARIAGGIVTWLSILLLPSSVFLFALPLSWMASLPPRPEPDNSTRPYWRLLVPALALLESLQAYPVAGTQLSLAAVGLMPVGAILLYDGIRQMRARATSPSLELVAPAAGVMSILALSLLAPVILSSFASDVPLDLRGAQSVRVGRQQAAAFHGIVDSIGTHKCNYVITYPGMDSFYIWTDVRSSLQTRYGQWYLILDASQQGAIVEKLRDEPGVCVVKDRALIDFWTRGRSLPAGPLVDFIDGSFVLAGTYGDYELLVPASP